MKCKTANVAKSLPTFFTKRPKMDSENLSEVVEEIEEILAATEAAYDSEKLSQGTMARILRDLEQILAEIELLMMEQETVEVGEKFIRILSETLAA